MSSKPTLYVFGGAVWPSAPWLASYVLGYEGKINIEQINLIEGANFKPEWLKVTSAATLPVIQAGDVTLTDTKSTVDWLVQNASKPAGKSSGTDFIDRIHEPAVDPNFAFLSARTEEELKTKSGGVPGLFIRNRQSALEKYKADAPSELAAIYTTKYAANSHLNTVYSESTSKEVKDVQAKWYEQSVNVWSAIRNFILTDIPAILPDPGYIGGEAPGEDDFHLAAWLARITLLTGGTPAADGVLSLKNELDGQEVPAKIVSYWKLWSETDAWKKVYENGLH